MDRFLQFTHVLDTESIYLVVAKEKLDQMLLPLTVEFIELAREITPELAQHEWFINWELILHVVFMNRRWPF